VSQVSSLAAEARQRRGELERQAGAALEVARQGKATVREVDELRAAVELYEKTAALLTTIGEEAQDTARHQVEELVTRALQVVFGDNLSFHLVPGERAGQATVDFVLRSKFADRWVDTPVMDARGGGMAAVVGFVLRLVVLLLTPGARRFLALDESFAHVSASYEDAVAEFLREVADKAGVQILLVTHSTAYSQHADTRVRLVLGPDGVTEVHLGESE
jgi:hypothetical protein